MNSNRIENINNITKQISSLNEKLQNEKKLLTSKIGSMIKNIREENKLTQEQFAERIGVGRTQVTNMELDNSGLTLQNLIIICGVFKVTSDSILGLDKCRGEYVK